MQGQSPPKIEKVLAPTCRKAFWGFGKTVSKIKAFADQLFKSSALVPVLIAVPLTSAKADMNFSALIDQYYSSHMALFSIFTGGMAFAFLMAILLIKKRILISRENEHLKSKLQLLNRRIEMADVLIQTPNQISILWPRGNSKPEIYGDLSLLELEKVNQNSLIAFGKWLQADSAKAIDDAVKNLRERAKPFELKLTSKNNHQFAAEGFSHAGRSIIHLKIFSKEQQQAAQLFKTHKNLKVQYEALRHSFDRMENLIWQRNEEGALIWVNDAFVHATKSASREVAICNDAGLLSKIEEQAVESVGNKVFSIMLEDRPLNFDVEAVRLQDNEGVLFVAKDITKEQTISATLERNYENHAEILNQLNSAIAIFDGKQNLQFFNQSFCQLWGISQQDLQGEPSNSAVLNLLRSQDKLEPQSDWVQWKNDLLKCYERRNIIEDIWRLPDNRIVKTIISPNRNGGVSWIFEDQSERMSLESNYKSLAQVQSESFDSLKEGICVFGLDGRLKLHNPAFAELWQIDESLLHLKPHISKITEHCKRITQEDYIWDKLYNSVTGFKDRRSTEEGKLSLNNDHHYHYALVPLPNGQAMLTFVDVSDTMRVQKVLSERNEALEAADRLKDNFIKHVSYELRTPLTHIIGFSDLLQNPNIGALNPKQSEYLADIKNSSNSLLAIVNDILDLVTVDAGVMSLEPQPISFEDLIHESLESVNERLEHQAYSLDIFDECRDAPLLADKTRLKQILVHLINNAIQYSGQDCAIHVALSKTEAHHCLSISDDGPGIPKELRKNIFKPFESQTLIHGRGGAGLGLTIVKSLVQLHGGYVDVEFIGHNGKHGTSVNCYFPHSTLMLDEAAE